MVREISSYIDGPCRGRIENHLVLATSTEMMRVGLSCQVYIRVQDIIFDGLYSFIKNQPWED